MHHSLYTLVKSSEKIKNICSEKGNEVMKIIFCNIAYMKYYKGIIEGIDEPENGGQYVKVYKNAHEAYNFDAIECQETENEMCLGYVRLSQSSENKTSEFHIEKINGCEHMEKEPYIDDVTVVWCAKSNRIDGMRVVGWYTNATALRNPEFAEFENGFVQEYNFFAEKTSCVLLPEKERYLAKWIVPRSGHNGYDFGFGRSNIWYAQGSEINSKQKTYIETILKQINNYNGENWIEKKAD